MELSESVSTLAISFISLTQLMTVVDPFSDVSPQNSRLEVMIFATFLFALINEYEGVEF